LKAIFRKEVTDYFTSFRIFILFLLVCLASALALYAAYNGIRGTTETRFVFLKLFTTPAEAIPDLFTFVNFIALFLIPIVGISIGFDAINREQSGGTMSRILSQPVYRDSVINGKFLAGIFTLLVMMTVTILIISGLGLRLIGVPPIPEEIIRLFFYLIFTVVFGAFWVGLAILFSIIFRNTAVSLLTSVAIWLFFGVFYILIAPEIANAVAPISDGTAEALIHNLELQQTLLRFSPNHLFSEASLVLLQPPAYGSLTAVRLAIPGNPLSLGQSMLLVWPHLTGLVSLTIVCFAISYVIFMRREIRST